MKIELEPTNNFEAFRGVQFRIYKGRTDTGVDLLMLGMFRIPNPVQRADFERQISQLGVGDTAALASLTGLSKP
jgi:hypothetical protein